MVSLGFLELVWKKSPSSNPKSSSIARPEVVFVMAPISVLVVVVVDVALSVTMLSLQMSVSLVMSVIEPRDLGNYRLLYTIFTQQN